MEKLVLVALGGAGGAVARYGVGLGSVRWLGAAWPGTLAVNVVGGLAMGVLAAVLLSAPSSETERWRLLLGVGALGGFTTFSAFSLETVAMLERRAWGEAGLYVAASVGLSLVALALGLSLARRALG